MTRRTRRQFMEDSMLATAMAAAATTPMVHAEETKQSDSPNEKLGVAVVGVRGRGGSHIGAFAGRKDTEILYIVDADSDVGQRRASEVGKRQGGRTPQFVEDMRRAFEDDRVDIVSIATPNHWHALAAIWAIQAGKDVYVEKPVSHNVSEGRRIVEAARKYGKIVQTGTQSRSNPGMRQTMDAIHTGKIGAVSVARGLCYKRRGSIGARGKYDVPGNVNYDLWLGPAPDVALSRPQFHYDWHWQWDYGNGDLGNQGIHQMDLARWALQEEGLSDSCISFGGRLGYIDAGDSANTQVVAHRYGDKALTFEVRGLETAPYKGAKIGVIVEGSDGYAVIPTYNSGTIFDKDGNQVKSFSGGADHFDNFIKAVRSRKIEDLTADIEEGHLSSALCHLGNISYRLGQVVAPNEVLEIMKDFDSADDMVDTFQRTMNHAKGQKVNFEETPFTIGVPIEINTADETIVGNAKANEMLTREYRKPFVVPAAGQV